ncbi:hypothetical protein NS258_16375, partial [Sphingomonas sanguinis]
MAIDKDVLDQLLAGRDPQELFAKDGLLDELKNAFVESFNGRLRDECLNETLFSSLAHARAVLAAWRLDNNTVRRHSQLGRRTPAQIAGQHGPGHAPD